MDKPVISRWLQLWRKAARLTQNEVTQRSGVPQYQVSRLENGEVEKPPMEDVVRLAAAYGVAPNEVARLAGWWTASPRYTTEDPRWTYVQGFLARASDEDREKLLAEVYDRALFHETLARLAEGDGEGEERKRIAS